MKTIDLSQEIDNDNGYIDNIVNQIREAKGEDLLVNITCVGGDVYQGARIDREIMLHDKHTKAVVIGLAASMGGVLLASFDEVEIDSDADIMLHKAHIMGVDEVSEDQKAMCERFNQRAYDKMKAKGVNEELLERVFLSDESEDYWLNAKEAEELGLGKVIKLTREEGKPIQKLVAKIFNKDNTSKQIYNEYKKTKMGLFDKKKPVARVLDLADGSKVIFNSLEENVKKGDEIIMVGSNEPMNGEYRINAKLKAVVDKGVISDLVEEEEEAPDMVAELTASLAALKDEFEKMKEGNKPYEPTEEEEAEKAKKEEEATAKAKAIEDKIAALDEKEETLNALVQSVFAVAKNINSNFVPPKVENKHEPVMDGLDEKTRRVLELKGVLTNKEDK